MKCPYSIIIIMLTSTTQLVFAQIKKKNSFPTYEQIRGNKSETYDFVAPQSIQANPTSAVPETGKYTLIKRSIVTEHGFDVFGYPKDSVTYILNGRKERDAKRAEMEIRTKSRNITDISIGAMDGRGRRVIRIDYEE
ncbi:hypothetical protein L0663_08090 [Dyadobacter sp. CY107]|uniref:hypothetical protein n=1 Tax=Dyadobacter fanqingshengii TaxID=2906443 RepID=UPI001F230171|nr:hypothetical protein [Dyadobacter fanqingshengii]MCF2503332.1 hypothetical protein [Dyadobacter fanqingshengii]